MANRLKHFRVLAGMTQTKVAQAVGVTQPTYQRWEAGSADIPGAKLRRLAQVFEVGLDALTGRHPAISSALYDDSAPDHLQYYGEVAFHFKGGGESLLLSISEDARRRVFQGLRHDQEFVLVTDLGNRTVGVRKSAISDAYFSSEAYDDFGPEHRAPGYVLATPVQLPDPRDWEIIESLAFDSDDVDLFADADVERIKGAVMITDEQYNQLVADGHIPADQLEAEKAKNSQFTDGIFDLATKTIYQLSTGEKRKVDVTDCDLYEAFSDLVEDGGSLFDERSLIVLQSEGYHRAVCINPDAVDYISIPTHLLEKSYDETSAEIIDELGDEVPRNSPSRPQQKSPPTNDD